MNKEEAIRRIKNSRQGLLNMISNISDADLTGIQVEGIWTIKDILGHLTAWDGAFLAPLSSYIETGFYQVQVITDHDAWNMAQSAMRSTWSFKETFQEFEFTRQQMLSQLDRLSDQQWEQTIEAPWGGPNTIGEILSGLAWHEKEHTKSIQKILPGV